MVRIRFFKRSYGFIATALCVAMISSSFGQSTNDQTLTKEEVIEQIITATTEFLNNWNNGYGNDPSGSDPSNPETTTTVTQSNPEPAQTGSVTDLLGIKETETSGPPESTSNPPIVPPTTTTNNPFDDIVSNGGNSSSSPDNEIITLPFGSVPLIRDDAASINYMLDSLLEDAEITTQTNGEELELTPEMRESYEKYARKLVKTLSKLSKKQQEYIFYGVTG